MNKLFFLFSKELYMLPTPSSISYFWNMGVLLMSCLSFQLVSGIFLSFHYSASTDGAFFSVVSIMNDINWGWLIRMMHANVASLFFIVIYLHIGRSLYYGGYSLVYPWISGVFILLTLMATAFLGYVLPWGQMSFWGATVITSLLSALPYIGELLVFSIWGGFSVSGPTLVRMFSIHFILPFVILIMVIFHIMLLHMTGSSNPLGLGDDYDKVSFHPYYSVKDFLSLGVVWMFLLFVVLQWPELFMDPDNFIKANPLVTPPHIQPEWYFLFAYSILRSIPSKLGGVIALAFSILILVILPMSSCKSALFSPMLSMLCWLQLTNFCLLTWLGSMPVDTPFIGVGQVISVMYFVVFLVWVIVPSKFM